MYLSNWKRYWREHLCHLAVGLVIGLSFNIPLAILVAVRQYSEYQKRDDTPGIDLAYHVAGSVTGSVIILILVLRFLA